MAHKLPQWTRNALLNSFGAHPRADRFHADPEIFAPESNNDQCFLQYMVRGKKKKDRRVLVEVDPWVGGYLKFLKKSHDDAADVQEAGGNWDGYLVGLIAHTEVMLREFLALLRKNNGVCNERVQELLYACMVRGAGNWGCNEWDCWAFAEELKGTDPLSAGRIGTCLFLLYVCSTTGKPDADAPASPCKDGLEDLLARLRRGASAGGRRDW